MRIKRLQWAVIASCGLCSLVHLACAQTWVQTSAPSTNWSSVASSADGCKLVAAAHGNFSLDAGPIYTSTNSGATWSPTSAPFTNWSAVASSADGRKLVVVAGHNQAGPIYSSTDSGVTWTQTSAPIMSWLAVASSADGNKLVAGGIELNKFYTSTNGGETWTSGITFDFGQVMSSVASSADGTRLIAGGCVCGIARAGRFYTSANSGTTWTPTSVNVYSPSIASSADGNKLVAVTGSDPSIYSSTNSGATWTTTSLSAGLVACSADGAKLVALTSGHLYISTNSGSAWTTSSAPSEVWQALASSADGCKIVAATANGGIYTWQSPPTPTLDIASSGGNAVISWTVPSARFELQESADLATTNWVEVTNRLVLNLTNLQNRVMILPSSGHRYYRLR